LTYDVVGNLISNVTATITNTYRWDARHELVEWQEVSATQTNKSQWSYNGFGQRVQEISYTNGVAVTTNKFLWAGGTQPVEQRDASGATVLKRYYGQGMQIVSGSDAGTYFYQRDHLGSVRAMTDSTGNLRGVWDYDPFGRVSNNLVTSNAVDSDFKFTGHFYHVKSKLHLTLYRAYDADTGRWISRDPIGENGGINLYGYCLNDPINCVDLLGLDITELSRKTHGYLGLADHYFLFVDNTGIVDKDGNPVNYVLDANNTGGLSINRQKVSREEFLKNGKVKDPDLRETKTITTTPEEAKKVIDEMRIKFDGIKYKYSWPRNDCGETLDRAEEILKGIRDQSK